MVGIVGISLFNQLIDSSKNAEVSILQELSLY